MHNAIEVGREDGKYIAAEAIKAVRTCGGNDSLTLNCKI
jgi:hypothetical protein